MKIAVLVSGGVDSSVVLALLKAQGHQVVAFYLKIWLEDELAFLGQCPWEEDLSYVQTLCTQLDVPLEIVSMQQAYHDKVVTYTINEIKVGRTPNPDIFCNSWIKFGVFYDVLISQFGDAKFDKIATGHYAQVLEIKDSVSDESRFLLKLAPDVIKDQTYFLARLTQDQLAKALFPIGKFIKQEVRKLACDFDLPTKDRKDSQGICFLGKLKFPEFVKHHLGEQKGNLIEHETGKIVGQHLGFWFYTIGQRQGLGLSGGPWYVVAKDIAKNNVYISKAYFDEAKERDTFEVANCHWILGIRPSKNHLKVKIRHGAQQYGCVINQLGDDHWQVTLAERDQGIAAGQYAVFYDNDVCLGAAMIIK